jgi:hypothetical protein
VVQIGEPAGTDVTAVMVDGGAGRDAIEHLSSLRIDRFAQAIATRACSNLYVARHAMTR